MSTRVSDDTCLIRLCRGCRRPVLAKDTVQGRCVRCLYVIRHGPTPDDGEVYAETDEAGCQGGQGHGIDPAARVLGAVVAILAGLVILTGLWLLAGGGR